MGIQCLHLYCSRGLVIVVTRQLEQWISISMAFSDFGFQFRHATKRNHNNYGNLFSVSRFCDGDLPT